MLDQLALGIANTAAVLDPEAIVLGGGYARAGAWLHDGLAERLARLLTDPPSLVFGQLGPDAALVGALHAAAARARQDIAGALERGALHV